MAKVHAKPKGSRKPMRGAESYVAPDPKRSCAIYQRVSTDDQSTRNQRAQIDRMIEARGWTVRAQYEENASAAAKRVEYEALLNDARKGGFRYLVIWSLDRFGRSMFGNVGAVLELERIGVRVVCACPSESWMDGDGPVRDLLIAIFSWIAEQERRRLGERTRAGMSRARDEGKHVGRPRARIDSNELELAMKSARATATYLPSATARSIARKLNVSESTLRRELARRRREQYAELAGRNGA